MKTSISKALAEARRRVSSMSPTERQEVWELGMSIIDHQTKLLQRRRGCSVRRGVMRPVWYETLITLKQLEHIEMLCLFHLQQSQNENAKEETRRLQWCLAHWPKPRRQQRLWGK